MVDIEDVINECIIEYDKGIEELKKEQKKKKRIKSKTVYEGVYIWMDKEFREKVKDNDFKCKPKDV